MLDLCSGLDKVIKANILKGVNLPAMDNDLSGKAISLALAGKWEEALKVNAYILKKNPKDVDTLNRLAKANSEVGNLTKAKSLAKKVTKLDPFNKIALKSLEKWEKLKKGEPGSPGFSSTQTFLEEPGKTKIVSLIRVGSVKTVAKLDSGDQVRLNTHGHSATVCTMNGNYIGRLPDDLSARLKQLLKHGNRYETFVKSSSKEGVKIFIREIKRVKKLADIPSFSSEKIDYISFTPPELVRKKEDIVTTDELD